MTADHWTRIIEATAWPICVVGLCLVFLSKLRLLISALIQRIESGASVNTPWVSLGVPSQLKSAEKDEQITSDHLALIHSSWRYPKKDHEFNRRMYAFHTIIQANPEVLDRIESVRYKLPGWPNPEHVITDRSTNFKLKELAWGEAILYATVKIHDQEDPVELSRYINLNETGPRI